MDKLTKEYRQEQFKKINNGDYKYLPLIKIYGSESNNTNCLSITKEEYEKIKQILIGEK